MTVGTAPQRSDAMELGAAERRAYLRGLRERYGPTVIAGETCLGTASQRHWEVRRHAVNARWRRVNQEEAPAPRRLLVTLTRRCTVACRHCWTFGSPTADRGLDLAALATIQRHLPPGASAPWTLSGGEPFAHPEIAAILSRFPVDCIYSNGWWGESPDRCRRMLDALCAARRANSAGTGHPTTVVLSYDRWHAETCRDRLHLAETLARILGEDGAAPDALAFRLSHAQRSPDDTSYREVLEALARRGFAIAATGQPERNGPIANLRFTFRKAGMVPRTLTVDTYPVTPIGRLLCGTAANDGEGPTDPAALAASGPIARYDFAVGPDGGVAPYQVLYAPPVPLQLGNLVEEPWAAVAARRTVDPIALTLETAGTAPFVTFLERHAAELHVRLAEEFQNVQQFLHLLLLDPLRRLLLNTFLLDRARRVGLMACDDHRLAAAHTALLEPKASSIRRRRLAALYPAPEPRSRR